MFSSYLILTLVVGADPQPTPRPLPKVEMPKLVDGLAPLKPLSSRMPLVRPVLSSATLPSQPSLNLSTVMKPAIGTTPLLPSLNVPTTPKPAIGTMPVPNGCGSETSFFKPSRVPQSVLGANFGKACDAHDICYGTFGARKVGCDNKFVFALYRSCLTAPGMSRTAPLCLGIANYYYAGVRLGGGPAFQQAQMQALMPPRSGPSLFGPPAPFTDKFGLLPKSDATPKYTLGVDTTILKSPNRVAVSPVNSVKPAARTTPNPAAPAWHPPMVAPTAQKGK